MRCNKTCITWVTTMRTEYHSLFYSERCLNYACMTVHVQKYTKLNKKLVSDPFGMIYTIKYV